MLMRYNRQEGAVQRYMFGHYGRKNKLVSDGRLTLSEIIEAFGRRDMLVLIPMYSLVLIPLACFMLWLCRKIDKKLNMPTMPRKPFNIVLWMLFTAVAGTIWWCTYAYLSLLGKGSPMTFVNRTKRLVISGPYAYTRNPSIVAKLLGVVGLGFLGRSFTFTFLLVPLLLTGSLIEKYINEEPALTEQFGEEFLEYKKNVPMFIPRVTKYVR